MPPVTPPSVGPASVDPGSVDPASVPVSGGGVALTTEGAHSMPASRSSAGNSGGSSPHPEPSAGRKDTGRKRAHGKTSAWGLHARSGGEESRATGGGVYHARTHGVTPPALGERTGRGRRLEGHRPHRRSVIGRRWLRKCTSVSVPSPPSALRGGPAPVRMRAIMTVLHAGALLERPPGPKYADALHFAELGPRAPLPRRATLEKWRDRMPQGLTLSLVAPKESTTSRKGPLRFDEGLEAGVAWLHEALETLGARMLVVPTGRDTTTGQRDRDLLAAYFDRVRREGLKVIWAPSGLWEPEMARPFAKHLGVTLACDPLAQPVPADEPLYARLRALGGRQRFTEGMFLDLQDALAEAEVGEAFVAIESPRSFREASRLQQLTLETGGVPAADEDDDEETEAWEDAP